MVGVDITESGRFTSNYSLERKSHDSDTATTCNLGVHSAILGIEQMNMLTYLTGYNCIYNGQNCLLEANE